MSRQLQDCVQLCRQAGVQPSCARSPGMGSMSVHSVWSAVSLLASLPGHTSSPVSPAEGTLQNWDAQSNA